MWDLVPRPDMEPGPLNWEHGVLAAGPPGKSPHHFHMYSSVALSTFMLLQNHPHPPEFCHLPKLKLCLSPLTINSPFLSSPLPSFLKRLNNILSPMYFTFFFFSINPLVGICFHLWATMKNSATSLVVQWLKLCASNTGGSGLIPGQGTRSHMGQLRALMP